MTSASDLEPSARVFELSGSKGSQIGDDNLQINVGLDAVGRSRHYKPVSIVPQDPLHRREGRELRGRKEMVGQLVELLIGKNDAGASRFVLLHGAAGSGKTSVAEQLAYEARTQDIEAWWVSPVDLLARMHAVVAASDPAARKRDAGTTTPEELWAALSRRHRPWLLVIDGVDDPALLAWDGRGVASGVGWIRAHYRGPGLVVVTSRDGTPDKWGTWWDQRQVTKLKPDDGALILEDMTRNVRDAVGTKEDARTLGERLDGLPLALKLAGAYLAKTARAQEEFPEQGIIATYAEYRSALDAGQVPIQTSDMPVIDGICKLSLDLLDHRGARYAKPLMRLLSSLADAPIPHRIVLRPKLLGESDLFGGLDSVSLLETVLSLAELGLIDISGRPSSVGAMEQSDQPPVVTIHPLVRYAGRLLENEGESSANYLAIAATLLEEAAQNCGDSRDLHTWPRWNALYVHCIYLLPVVVNDPDTSQETLRHAATTAHLAAGYMAARGQFRQAQKVFEQVLEVRGALPGDNTADLLDTRQQLGDAIRDSAGNDPGPLTEAERQLRAVCAEREKLLAGISGDQEGRISKLANSGWRTPEGLAIIDRNWDPGLQQPFVDLLDGYQSLAIALAYQSSSSPECKNLYLAVYEAQKRLLGEEDARTLATRTGLAARLFYEDRMEEAEREFAALCQIGSQLADRGVDHPDTLVDRAWHASALENLGRLEEAEQEWHSVYIARRQVLGPTNRETLHSLIGLARVLVSRARQAASAYEQGKPPATEGSAEMADAGSGAMNHQQWLQNALAYFQEALTLTNLEEEPTFYGVILHDIAETHEAMNDLSAAIAAYTESVQYKSKGLPGNSWDVATTTLALGECQTKAGGLTEAREALARTRELIMSSKVDPARKAVRLHSVGRAYEQLGDEDQPDAYAEALAVFRDTCDLLDVKADPASYATVLNNTGDVEQKMGELNDAYTHYAAAVDYMRQVADDTDTLAAMLIDLGRVARRIGRTTDGTPEPPGILAESPDIPDDESGVGDS